MIQKTLKTTTGKLKVQIPDKLDEVTLGQMITLQENPALNDLEAISILSGIPIGELQNVQSMDDFAIFGEAVLSLSHQIKHLYNSDIIPKKITFATGETVNVMSNLSVEPAGAFMAAREIIGDEINEHIKLYGDEDWLQYFNPSLKACCQVLAHYFYCRATGKRYNEYEAEEFTAEIKQLRVTEALPIAKHFFTFYPSLSTPKTGSQVTITVDTDYTFGDVPTISYAPGGNKIQDLAGNFAAALINQAVTNNVLPGTTSAFITNINQTLRTMVVPSALDFYGGSSIVNDKPFSISFWINRNNTLSGRIMHLYSTVNDTAPGYDLTIDSSGNLNFLLGSHFLNHHSNGPVISPNTWTHVAITYDGLKAGSGIKFYYNGNLIASTGDASYVGQMGAFDANIRLAVFSDIQTPPVNPLYNVKLDALYFWNKELSNLEVLNVYNSGALIDPSTLTFVANLVVGYEFNNNANDFGPNGYNLASTTPPTYSSDHV